jgi:hypothetical protein
LRVNQSVLQTLVLAKPSLIYWKKTACRVKREITYTLEQADKRWEQMNDVITVTEGEVEAWLKLYKSAWENRDLALIVTLFTEKADYRERHFGESLLGHKDVRSYWENRVFEHQRDISVDHQIWGVRNNEAMSTWQASFMWLPINSVIQIDGVVRMTFSERRDGVLVCSHFHEWMDYDEVSHQPWQSRPRQGSVL